MEKHEHPIAAPATALAKSAISVVRCSGRGSIEMFNRIFRPAVLEDAPSHTIHHGRVVSGSGEIVDEVMAAVLRAPATYTGEDSVEIYGHGSPAGVRRILAALYDAGFHPAAPGEFSRRAFLNGKMDLTRAEAVNDLVNAQTVHAHRLALERLSGGVRKELDSIRGDLVKLSAGIAVQLDYPEEDSGDASLDVQLLSRCLEKVSSLAGSYGHGRLVQEGITVALAGRTNAGKSSLFNALLRQDRSIVSDLPGTTRDYLEAMVDVQGFPVRLFDTAGLRHAGHDQGAPAVEAEGIRRSRAVIAAADLGLYVVDGTSGLSDEDRRRIEEIRSRTPVLLVWNKTDLGAENLEEAPPDAVSVSAITGAGLEDLNRAIANAVSADGSMDNESGSAVVIDSERQHHLLRRAEEALKLTLASHESAMPADVIAVDLQDAVNAIGEITGEVTTDEVLDTMFGSFCLGK